MISKNEIKYIQSLCHKKQRQQDNIFIAEGTKIIEELLNSCYNVKKIYATNDWMSKNTPTKVQVIEVSEQEMSRLSSLQTPSSVLAIVETNSSENLVIKGKINVVLDGIQDPGNFGTIIRIADWFGIENIFCSEDTVNVYNNKVIQSSMGSFVRVNIWYGNIETIIHKSSLPVFGAVLNGKNIDEQPNIEEGFLIIGNEGNGIRTNMLPYITYPITIPKKGGAESLNAAVATGILLSKLVK
ncbi:MAG: RNA methyltransferase [Chitinophagaceae bacterium]|nr:RNA methyltransferase [Chitinophagaceae bacterium]MCW5905848.1 RNA methyltransferase [Chitinophagaceae bacterium]